MATTAGTLNGLAFDQEHALVDSRPFIRRYIFSTDHKIIGIQFLLMSLLFLLTGGTLAMLMRWQLGFPNKTLPIGGLFPDTMVQDGTILPEFYNSLVTMHGTFMVFFAIMPLLVGVFGNYLIPLKIGAPDMAFPRINMMSFWVAVPAGIIMLAGFFVEGGHAAAGWTGYAPLSARPDLSGVTLGQQLWCVSHFFLPDKGGQPLLWQHLFWFFGHPEVYILILPAMGMVSDIIANGSRKPIFGYHSMVFAIIGIAFLGWIVWGHHMFMSGMNPTLGSTFMVSTLLIAVPSAIKVFNWLGTMWRGNIRFHVPMLNAIGFVSMFTIGGLSGIFMAATPVDIP